MIILKKDLLKIKNLFILNNLFIKQIKICLILNKKYNIISIGYIK